MPPNETTVLLTNYREKRMLNTPRTKYGSQTQARVLDEVTDVHIVNVSKDPEEYERIFSLEEYPSSLTLAELLPFQDDPWWQKFRLILFFLFWLIFLFTLITACLIAYLEVDGTSCPAISSSPSPPTLLASPTALTTMSSILSSKLAIMP
uniref:Solute carrier family 3 member 2 N-terminal domain-containing protein n=1 Tax=Musca domestica TaxID=7370 RepID=A0A1I8MAR8_MUSDO